MKTTILPTIFLLSVSCTSVSQEKTVAVPDSIITDTVPIRRITLLFAGDLMQHQTQINDARTSGGYSYSENFAVIKEEIQKADVAIANL